MTTTTIRLPIPEMYSTHLFLGRQPILGREQQLLAYELLFRDGVTATGNRADIRDPTHATATVIANTFAELATNDVLGPYRGFINVDYELLFSDLIEALPKTLTVIEVLENIEPTAEVIARCQELQGKGFTLAVDDVVRIDEANRPLLALVDIIKIDILRLDADSLRVLVAELKPLGKALLAEKVETAAQFALCQGLGFDLFQGYHFAKPIIVVGKKLERSQAALLRLLAMVMRDAETAEIENAFKTEPGLMVNMLRLTNSVSCGLSIKITSLRHAITILGRRQLQRWLQLLVYTNPKGGSRGANPLLQLAATRGRMMELLADRLAPKSREFSDQGFMVGIMSLMPALLGMAMVDILAQLPVAQRVKQALTDGSGQHGQLLDLVVATEQPDPALLEEAIERLPGISAAFVESCLSEAFAWANNLEQDKSAVEPS